MPALERIPKVFISYANEDRAIAGGVTNDLRAQNIDVWIDREGLVAGTPDWDVVIREAVAESSGVVLIATPASRASQVVQSELLLAEMIGVSIYPLWAAGEKWIDAIPLNLSRAQHHDIRGDAYTSGITELVRFLSGEGYALPPHFLYRAFHQVLPPDARAPKGTRQCGSRSGHPVYQKAVPEQYMVVEHTPWFGDRSHDNKVTFDAIMIRPSAYRMGAQLLDALYLEYLADRFDVFTYGSSWVLCTGPFGDGVLAIDARELQDGQGLLRRTRVSRQMTETPGRYNLAPGERFIVSTSIPENLQVVAARDPWITKKLIRHPKGKHALVSEILRSAPIGGLNLAEYPYVAVVSSHYLPHRYDPAIALVQQSEVTQTMRDRFDD